MPETEHDPWPGKGENDSARGRETEEVVDAAAQERLARRWKRVLAGVVVFFLAMNLILFLKFGVKFRNSAAQQPAPLPAASSSNLTNPVTTP